MFGKISTPTNYTAQINHHIPGEAFQISKTSHLLKIKLPRKPTSLMCNNNNFGGLEFIRGTKLLSGLSSWGIGGPCNYFLQVFHQTQLLSALRRRVSQPVGEQTAGSVFRNPSNMGVSAAELIERAGLKGVQVGGAMVSSKHANFFINCGPTSKDMLELIGLVKEIVYQKFGVLLREEIMYINP